MKLKANKGFTLIELLVVIAIIGILAGVVLVSLNTARGKAQDAAIKTELGAMRAEAEIFYDDNSNSYTDFCADPKVATVLTNKISEQGGTLTCDASPTQWAASSPLVSKAKDFCADSDGTGKEIDTGTRGTNTVCP